MTKKRVDAIASQVVPDEEVKRAYEEIYTSMLQTTTDPFNMNEAFKGHCMYSALAQLKERFPKEQVDTMEKYLMNQKGASVKPRRRYVKVPSGKRPHYTEMIAPDFVQMNPEAIHPDAMMSLMYSGLFTNTPHHFHVVFQKVYKVRQRIELLALQHLLHLVHVALVQVARLDLLHHDLLHRLRLTTIHITHARVVLGNADADHHKVREADAENAFLRRVHVVPRLERLHFGVEAVL